MQLRWNGVNGVVLGPEPTPLIHGDKIEIGGVELLFGDDRSAGSTQYLGAPRAAARAAAPALEKATAATGGRLVSLVDGREYSISASGVTMAQCLGRGPLPMRELLASPQMHADRCASGACATNDSKTAGAAPY